MSQENEQKWTRHTMDFEHADGRVTTFYMHTDDRRFVLSEHPENRGPAIWNSADKIGDEIIRESVQRDSKNKPEDLVLYAERQDGRFDRWEAKTTLLENISNDPMRFEHRASEWQWKNAHQYPKDELQKDVDVQIESGHPSYGRMNSDEKAQHDWKNFSAETSVKSETVKKAREEIKQSRGEEAAQQSQQHETEAQTQKQKHER